MAALGLLGGTFDPIHRGHLRAGLETGQRLGLDRVDLLPAADPPLKASPRTSAGHRLAMVAAAVADEPLLGVDDRELHREGVSYTVDTLRSWRAQHGGEDSLVFVVGQDVLPSLPQWSRWEELLEHCHLAVLVRPGFSQPLPEVVATWLDRHGGDPEHVTAAPAGTVIRLDQPPVAVSSTEIRAALATGQDVQHLLPARVLEYIRAHELYGASDAPPDRE